MSARIKIIPSSQSNPASRVLTKGRENDIRSRTDMEMIVLGTDHGLQAHDQRLRAFIVELVERNRVTMIAEENRISSVTIAREVSESMGFPRVQIDMSIEDRIKAGIDGKLANRMQIRGYDAEGRPRSRRSAMPQSRTELGRSFGWIESRGVQTKEACSVICGGFALHPIFGESHEARAHNRVQSLLP